MASYVDNNLIKDEAVIHRGQLSGWSLFPHIFFGVLLIPIFGLGLILLIAAYIKFISTELAVTNKRVIAKTGFISRDTIEMNIAKVESMQVNQGISGRIFNFGSLQINGTGTSHAPILGIRDPLYFRRKFMEAQDQLGAARVTRSGQ